MLAVIQAKADQQLTTATGIPVPIASYLFVSAVNGSDANRKPGKVFTRYRGIT
jgi:hypothetical protein